MLSAGTASVKSEQEHSSTIITYCIAQRRAETQTLPRAVASEMRLRLFSIIEHKGVSFSAPRVNCEHPTPSKVVAGSAGDGCSSRTLRGARRVSVLVVEHLRDFS